MDLSLFNCGDLEELKEKATRFLKITHGAVAHLDKANWPLDKLYQIDELERKIATYEMRMRELGCRGSQDEGDLPAAAKRYRVFISYVEENTQQANQLYEELMKLNIETFFAPKSILVSQNIVTKIEAALQQVDLGVILWSGKAAVSRWIDTERSEMMMRRNKGDCEMLFVLLEDEKVPMISSKYIDARVNFQATVISKRIADTLAEPPTP